MRRTKIQEMVSARPPFCSDFLDFSLLASPLCWMHNGHFLLLFGLSVSFAHGLWSPVIVILAVGCDRMVSKYSGLCVNQSKRLPLGQGHSSTWCWVWVSCFPPPLLCNSPATALASSPSCPLMGGLGCLTFLTPLSVLRSWCSGVPYPHRTVSVWSYQNCPSESLCFAIHKCLELSGSKKS